MTGNKIGAMIREGRFKRGLKQLELARILGISRTYLSDLENDRYFPSGKLLFKISKELGIFFIHFDGNTFQKKNGW